MFRISSQFENNIITIFILFNEKIISKKTLQVDLTGQRVPTFSPNYYEFSNDEFTNFILSVEKNEIAIFAFDNDESRGGTYDGLSYAENNLLFITSYSGNTITNIITTSDKNRLLIVSDLKALQVNLLQSIYIRTNEADILECVDYDSENEEKNINNI